MNGVMNFLVVYCTYGFETLFGKGNHYWEIQALLRNPANCNVLQ